MTRISHVGIGCACLCLLTVSSARADPVVVTGGSFTQIDFHSTDAFFLDGNGFHLVFGAEFTSGMRDQCSPCTVSGARPLSFNASTGGDFLSGAAGVFNGVSYPATFLSGPLVFSGPTFSSALLSTSNLTFSAPFSFTGVITDFASARRDGPPVFSTALTGSGTATAKFSFEPGSSPTLFDIESVTYAFEPPAATPEPASILLLGTGCLGLARLRRWRRNRRTGVLDGCAASRPLDMTFARWRLTMGCL
jgi:PEP-CTERM motif